MCTETERNAMTTEHKERIRKLADEMLEMVDVLAVDENVDALHPAVKHCAEGAIALYGLIEDHASEND